MSKVYLIGTAHDQYRQREFEPGDVVIDPWRMIPDQEGVTVRRLGENKPAMISVLVPSRGRPEAFKDMQASMWRTATFPNRVHHSVQPARVSRAGRPSGFCRQRIDCWTSRSPSFR